MSDVSRRAEPLPSFCVGGGAAEVVSQPIWPGAPKALMINLSGDAILVISGKQILAFILGSC